MSKRWNELEDGQPSKSQLKEVWDNEQLVWRLEVRERAYDHSFRLGEIFLRGDFAGELLIGIEETDLLSE